MAAVDLSELKDKPSGEQELIEVETAFLVTIRNGMVVQASPDINQPVSPRREPTIDEMQLACRKVVDDIQASKTAHIMQAQLEQRAAMAHSAMQEKALREKLGL